MNDVGDLVRVSEAQPCCSSPWEDAYTRFETPEQEIAKFTRRLRKLGATSWDRSFQVVELFCGRGSGLRALSRLGFRNLEGIDLSESLLAKYEGPAKRYVCDCRHLPFENASRDVVIVQGGLHHLARLPEDLEMTLAEMRRVLRPGGFTVIIEPWLTPFLRCVHALCRARFARRLSSKIDALATMIENERETYDQWLNNPALVRELIEKTFDRVELVTRWGKITALGRV